MLLPLRDYRPSGSFPIITVAIIALDVLIYLYQALILGGQPSPYRVRVGFHVERLSLEDLFLFTYGAQPCEVLGKCTPFPPASFPVWLTVITAMFLHGGVLHLVGNMWYLWIFGDNVEDAMGHGRFLLFYLLTGVIAALAQIFANPSSQIPMVGASGAIAGVLGAYMVLYPQGRVLTLLWMFYFIRFIELPALIVLGFWFLIQLLSYSLNPLGGGVAWMAHIGGFLAGALLVRFFAVRPRRPYWEG
jgi:membrane associated rhomboid family serine protease